MLKKQLFQFLQKPRIGFSETEREDEQMQQHEKYEEIKVLESGCRCRCRRRRRRRRRRRCKRRIKRPERCHRTGGIIVDRKARYFE